MEITGKKLEETAQTFLDILNKEGTRALDVS